MPPQADEIYHLGNRRVRSAWKLLQNKVRIGLQRFEWIAYDYMNIRSIKFMSSLDSMLLFDFLARAISSTSVMSCITRPRIS